MHQRNKGGQFALIPAAVLYDAGIPATAKLLYGEIYRLSRTEGYCYASNRAFTEILGCSEATVTRLLSALAGREHVRVQFIRRYGDKGDIVQRRIFCRREPEEEGPRKDADPSPQTGGDGVGKGGGTTTKKTREEPSSSIPQGTAVYFARFWKAYPKKRGKDAARRAWKRLGPDIGLCRRMGEALERQKHSRDWQRDGGRYIPYPASWLNGRRWEDEEPEGGVCEEGGYDGI
ncbi:MAG: helix-turn-helix domain-containing protein [Oscillibacter sp.]|nr:helix-turn-helix domain-containing protein [Oscillibacter sp.]